MTAHPSLVQCGSTVAFKLIGRSSYQSMTALIRVLTTSFDPVRGPFNCAPVMRYVAGRVRTHLWPSSHCGLVRVRPFRMPFSCPPPIAARQRLSIVPIVKCCTVVHRTICDPVRLRPIQRLDWRRQLFQISQVSGGIVPSCYYHTKGNYRYFFVSNMFTIYTLLFHCSINLLSFLKYYYYHLENYKLFSFLFLHYLCTNYISPFSITLSSSAQVDKTTDKIVGFSRRTFNSTCSFIYVYLSIL